MAKRTPRSSAQDAGAAGTATPPQQKVRRRTNTRPAPELDTIAADAGVEGEENFATGGMPSEAGDDAPLESMSMGSEPSEEDIRNRAYRRYLERGGGHGQDFEDWLEAERELKNQK